MKIFGTLKYLDAKYLFKKIFGNTNVADTRSKLSDLIKKTTAIVVKECSTMQEKVNDLPGTNYKLGLTHLYQGNISDAILRFRLVCYFTPKKKEYRTIRADSFYNLGRCMIISGEYEEAEEKLKIALEINKNHSDAKYHLEKLQRPESIKLIPVSTIKEISDIRETRYKEDYIDAGYNGANLLVNESLLNITDKNPNLEVLDLGCGTGECGKLLKMRNVAKKITGVDIAEQMVKQTLKRKVDKQKVYDAVEEITILDFLKKNRKKYDLILSDMSFDYYGDLSEIAGLLKKSLNTRSLFSLIIRKEGEIRTGYKLNVEYDDFSHSEEYIRDSFKKAGFSIVDCKEIDIVDEEKGILYVFIS